jgi:hypothetical protein
MANDRIHPMMSHFSVVVQHDLVDKSAKNGINLLFVSKKSSQVFNHFRRNDDYNKSQTASLQSGFFSLTMVPEAGLEPAWIMHPRDFESKQSLASTIFFTLSRFCQSQPTLICPHKNPHLKSPLRLPSKKGLFIVRTGLIVDF